MKFFRLIVFIIFLLTISVFSQTKDNSAPVKWENYKITDNNLTVKFPKLPVRLDFTDLCRQTTTNTYYAYADEVVYEFKVHEKAKKKIPDYCTEKEKFDESNFKNYLKEMQTRPDFESVKSAEKSDFKFFKFEKTYGSHKYSTWILDDYKNFRWFEFTISTFKEKEIDEIKFVESLKFKADKSAIEINAGSPVVLGDADFKQNSLIDKNKQNTRSSALHLILKPKPKYTDEARENNISGDVRMRVTFLPNGAIGSVSPVTNLPYGLTEQAIEAAKKMAFLPQRQNDIKVAVTRVVVYTFSIY